MRVVWDRIFLHSNSPASQWAPMFLFLLELLRRASEALKKESRFSELIQRLVNMPFRDLCRGNGACRTIEEARRWGVIRMAELQYPLARWTLFVGGDLLGGALVFECLQGLYIRSICYRND